MWLDYFAKLAIKRSAVSSRPVISGMGLTLPD